MLNRNKNGNLDENMKVIDYLVSTITTFDSWRLPDRCLEELMSPLSIDSFSPCSDVDVFLDMMSAALKNGVISNCQPNYSGCVNMTS